jgi:plasmid stabilization system protein ParE
VRVRWLKAARRNLDAALEYVAREDPEAAARMYACIRERVAALAAQPNMGRPGRVFGTRELVIERYPYLIPYRIHDDEVQILRVFHTSRRPSQFRRTPA